MLTGQYEEELASLRRVLLQLVPWECRVAGHGGQFSSRESARLALTHFGAAIVTKGLTSGYVCPTGSAF
jgi:hypothetical protein